MAAKANEKSEASLREAEELMRRMDSPDRIAYQSCRYHKRKQREKYCCPLTTFNRNSDQGIVQIWRRIQS